MKVNWYDMTNNSTVTNTGEGKSTMGLHTVSIMHIGDVHWPEAQQVSVDRKDRGFSANLEEAAALTPAEVAIRFFAKNLATQDSILFVGDLTTKGALTNYEQFLERLAQLVGPNINKVRVVSGNHDISRQDCSDDDLYSKFNPINNALLARGFTKLPINEPVYQRIDNPYGHLLITALNSCLGCGVTRRYLDYNMPAKLQAVLAPVLESLKKEDDQALYEELDTPAFDARHLMDVLSKLDGDDKTLPVILTHHNLLPQETPRLMAYAELVNAGIARSILTQMNRPVLYLHGHLHAEPVEILRSPRFPRSMVVSICAPEFQNGYNVLEITFNSRGYPLGCTVTPWRKVGQTAMAPAMAMRIPFWNPGFAHEILRESSHEVWDVVRKATKPDNRFSELQRKPTISSRFSEKDLADSLVELEWLGMIDITDRANDPKRWVVRRVL